MCTIVAIDSLISVIILVHNFTKQSDSHEIFPNGIRSGKLGNS